MKIDVMNNKYTSYLRDESRIQGRAEAIAFPKTQEEAQEVVSHARRTGMSVTPQGARTGLTGGAVPEGGLVISCCGMKNLEWAGEDLLHAEAGVTLEQLHSFLRKETRLFPPNPTEETATLGGMFGCNAMGIDGEKTGDWVEKLWWLTGSGEVWEIPRGVWVFDREGCNLPDGTRLSCETFENTGLLNSGIAIPGLDLIDFLAGTEGSLGMALAFDLRLSDKKAFTWGVLYFMDADQAAMDFCRAVSETGGRVPVMEYYDRAAVNLLAQSRATSEALKEIPEFPANAEAAVYIELSGNDSEVLEAELFSHLDIFEGLGGTEEQTWAASETYEVERFRKLRHALPELVNAQIDACGQTVPGLTRVSADFRGPADKAAEYLKRYHAGILESGAGAVVYGAVAENRFHVNFILKTPEELSSAREIIKKWAEKVVCDGGQLVTENGVGQLKRELVCSFVPDAVKKQLQATKAAIDPEGVFK